MAVCLTAPLAPTDGVVAQGDGRQGRVACILDALVGIGIADEGACSSDMGCLEHPVGQPVDIGVVEQCVVVEQKEQSATGFRNAQIVSSGKSQVLRAFHDADWNHSLPFLEPSVQFVGFVSPRTVIHHNHFHAESGRGDGGYHVAGVLPAVIVDGDEGDVKLLIHVSSLL